MLLQILFFYWLKFPLQVHYGPNVKDPVAPKLWLIDIAALQRSSVSSYAEVQRLMLVAAPR